MFTIAILFPVECRPRREGIGEGHDHLAADEAHVDLDRAARIGGLDAVVDGVLDQRLQHQRRHHRVAGIVSVRQVTRRRSPSLRLSSARYWRTSSTSSAIGARRAVVGHEDAEEAAMSSSARSARRGSERMSDRTALMLL
jgi:hypothetical protein